MNKLAVDEIKLLVDQTLKILTSRSKKTGEQRSIQPELYFISFMIKGLVENALNVKFKKTDSDEYKFQVIKQNFEAVKFGIQEAVATAFQVALRHYSQKQIEYYCVIKPVPETTSKEVH